MCRVFIADDVKAIRRLWTLYLEEDPAVQVIGEAADGNEALAGVAATRPDVLVLDLSMPERDGLEVIPLVRECSPGTAIVVASSFSRARIGQLAEELGAVAYFEKGGTPDEFRELVRGAHAALATAGVPDRRR